MKTALAPALFFLSLIPSSASESVLLSKQEKQRTKENPAPKERNRL